MNIKLNNISKIYEGKTILNNINLDIKNVKVVGIIGESGCGKSTLLRQLIGIEFPNEGTITINNNKITLKNLKDYQSKVGMVFQKHNLFPHLTVQENITLILMKVKKIDKLIAQKNCRNLLKTFHLIEQADKIPSKISGGQAQRAAIVRAISTSPDLLFLDEPTAALDPLLTNEVLKTIEKLRDEGMEFIFVTHEMAFLQRFADYFVFMDKGSIVEHGQIQNLNTPKTNKLRNFITR